MEARNEERAGQRAQVRDLDHAARVALIRQAAELETAGDRRAAAELLAMLNAAARREQLPIELVRQRPPARPASRLRG